MENIIKKIINLVNDNDKIVACVSGGPDSMCLLNLLIQVRKAKAIKIIVAHVNHNVRKESDEEAIFVEKYCKENNVIYEYLKIEKYNENNFHQEARNIRYDFFEKIIQKYHANFLFTAHHGDDLIESILMKLVRGSRFYGYLGFKELTKRDNYILYRPLINKTKEEIINYLKKNDIPYVIDKSNTSNKYTRNRYRKSILPFLKQEDKNVHLKFKKFSDIINEHYEFIYKLAMQKLEEVYKDGVLKIDKFLMQEKILQQYIIEEILYNIYGDNIYLIYEKHVEEIYKLIESKKQNSKINLPSLVITKSYNNLYFNKFDTFHNNSITIFQEKVILNNGKKLEKIKKSEEKSNYVLRLDSSEILLPLKVRYRQNGDRIAVKNLSGTKKINDIFIDNKIELNKRDTIPIVTDSKNRILWIAGVKKSKFDKEKNEKHDIIIKYN